MRLLGWWCTALSVAFVWPQVARVYRQHTVEGIAPKGTLHGGVASTLWMLYGLALGDPAISVANAAVVLAMSLIAIAADPPRRAAARVAVATAVGVAVVGGVGLAVSPSLVGWLAIVVGATSVLPQTVHVLRAPSLHGVSVPTYALLCVTTLSWASYGVGIGDPARRRHEPARAAVRGAGDDSDLAVPAARGGRGRRGRGRGALRRPHPRSGVGHTGPVPAPRPLILAVDDDPADRERLHDELATRYQRDYDVQVTPTDGCPPVLEALEGDGTRLALLLVANGPAADEVLGRARALQPQARRALLLTPTNTQELTSAPAAITRGLADLVVVKPHRQPDEAFHRIVTEALHDWRRAEPVGPVAVRVVGERWSARSQAIRDRLERNGVSYTFHAADSPEGAALLHELDLDAGRLPVFVLFDGQVLVQPDDSEVADRMAAPAPAADRLFDVAIVGAGPAGLAAAVYASSEGLATLVLEQEAVGGQAGTSSLIRNYLGFPHGIPGRDLALRAAQQAWLFGAGFHWMRSAVSLGQEDGAEHHPSSPTAPRSAAGPSSWPRACRGDGSTFPGWTT